MKQRLSFLMIPLMMLALFSCSPKSGEQQQDGAHDNRPGQEQRSLVDKRWKLVEIMGKPLADMDLAREPFIRLTGEAEGFRLAGNDGCNNIMGSYDVGDHNTISFSKLASTEMACMKGDLQKEMSEVFEQADNYTLSEDGTMLSLNKAKMAPLARFEVDHGEGGTEE